MTEPVKTEIQAELDRSRARLAELGNRFRVVVVFSFWLLHLLLGYAVGAQNWHGNLHIWSLYLGLAIALHWVMRRRPALRPRSMRLVLLLDMPMLFWTSSTLAALSDDPSAVVGLTGGGFVMLVLWSVIGLEPRMTMLAAAEAGVLEAALFHGIGSDPGGLIASILLLLAAGFHTVLVTRNLGAAMAGVTEARLREEQSERTSQEKDRFVSTVSHDFRSPLSVLLASLQTLRDHPGLSETERRDFLERAIRQCRRLMGLTEDLLRLARLGSQRPTFETLDLGSVVASVVGDLSVRAAAQGARLSFHAAGPAPVLGSRALLDRALTNLLDNAIRHGGAVGPVEVTVRPGQSLHRVDIRDSGPGIDPDLHDRIFEPFFRGDEGPEAGSGLGLAIVREVARAHGGRAEVDSRPGEGARFSLLIPGQRGV